MSDYTIKSVHAGTQQTDGAALTTRARECAAALAAEGIERGDFVGLLFRNDLPMLEITMAVQWLGAYAVPINWHSEAGEIRFVIEDCGARLLFAHVDLFRKARRDLPDGLKTILCETPRDIADAYSLDNTSLPLPPDGIPYEDWLDGALPIDAAPIPPVDSVFYTSGTMGRPKGVRRQPPRPDQIAQSLEIRRLMYDLKPESVALLAAPFYHGGPNMFAILCLRKAGSLILPPRFEPEMILQLIERYRVTHIYLVPIMMVRLLKLPEEVRNRYDLSSLRVAIHGGGPCPIEAKRAMIDWWGPLFREYYGSTEVGPVSLCTSEEWLAHPGTVGKAIPGVEIMIVDEAGKPCATGEEGEICTKHELYPDFTYINQSAARAELKIEGHDRSGDIGYLDEDGFLFVCDRKKDMIISGGVNIYPAEIEPLILSLEGVVDCAVFGIPDPEFGESVAAVVQTSDSALTPESIRARLEGKIASFKVPKHYEIRDKLPREESGKIKKRLLRDSYWQGRYQQV